MDLKYFYENVLAEELPDRKTGKMVRRKLSRFHDWLIDFLRLHEVEALHETNPECCHTPLWKLLPPRNEENEYKERWIYLPTLHGEPQVQDGREGPISAMFTGKFWQGLVIRIKGDGLSSCVLAPRGHLKSTLCTQAHVLWRLIRDPSERHLIRSLTCHLARSMMGDVKFQFEMNPRFRRLFGDLGPPSKGEPLAWNADFFRLRSPHYQGRDPSAWAMGMDSEVTGGHVDFITLDDVMGEGNIETAELRAKARQRVERLHAVRDPHSRMLDVGTRWSEDDVHSMFLNVEEEALETCFLVATCRDAENKPLWPEEFTDKVLSKKRRAIQDDHTWFGQYYNQFTGTSARTFRREWERTYQGTPEDVAKTQKLNIYIGVDTASGKREQKGQLDYTAACVLGQSQDRMQYFVLDGFKEKLPAADIAKAIIALACRWRNVAHAYGGVFRVGVEDTAFTSFLQVALDYEMRERGVNALFAVEPIKVTATAKVDRIRVLAQPYSEGRVAWPVGAFVAPVAKSREPYDLAVALREEFVGYPGVAHDDLLDGHARAYELAAPRDFAGAMATGEARTLGRGRYSRNREEEDRAPGLSGYATGSWGPNDTY